MKSETKFVMLVIGLPIAGLVYCIFVITLMSISPTVREHPLISGTIFMLIPFSIAATIWLLHSQRAYRNPNSTI